MFRKLGTKRSSRNLQGGVSEDAPDNDPKIKKIIANTQITDLVLREYKKEEFDEEIWRLKWEDFVHPHTGESGMKYLERMTDNPALNPRLQQGSKVIIVIEPLYGLKR